MSRLHQVRRWGYVTALAALLAGAVAYRYLTDPQRIRRQAELYLARFVNADVSVGTAEFSFFQGVHLTEVALSQRRNPPTEPDIPQGEPRRMFYCRDLLLRHDPVQALFGRLAVTEVVAVKPTCVLVEDARSGRSSLTGLLVLPAGGKLGRIPLPVVRLRDASLHLMRRLPVGLEPVETLHMHLLAEPDPAQKNRYQIAWTGGASQHSSGRSSLDLHTMTLTDEEGGLPWLSIEAVTMALGTQVPGAAEYLNMLGLSGEVRAQEYNISPAAGVVRERKGTVKLRSAAFSVPIDADERLLPSDQRYFQFTDVDGTVEFSADKVTAGFTALLHGSRVQATVCLQGSAGSGGLADLGFDIDFTADNMELPGADPAVSPPEARFVSRWRKLRNFYRDFDPHGRASIRFSVVKGPGADEPIQLRHGRIEGINADAAYRFFRYRVSGLRGVVEFDDQGVHLRDLKGSHGGAPIVVNGWLAEPRWYAAAKLTMTGMSVPLDVELHDALSTTYRPIWDQFALAGASNIAVQMERAAGTPEDSVPWTTTVRADLIDADLCYVGFPYPVHNARGRVEISPEGIRVTRLSASAGGGTVITDGHAGLRDGALSDLHLELKGDDIPFDDVLFHALPPHASDLVQSFTPQGTFGLSGLLTHDPGADHVLYDMTATLRNTRLAHANFPLPLNNVGGTLRLRPGRIDVAHIEGRYRDCSVTATGSLAGAPGAEAAHVTVTCRDLPLDNDLKTALPPRLAEAARDFDLAGSVDTITTLDQTPSSNGFNTRQETDIQLSGVSLRHAAFPLPLTNVRGRVVVADDHATFENVTAEHGNARFTLDGELTQTPARTTGSARLVAIGLTFDEDLRQAVPWRWRRTWNNLQPAGAVNLDLPGIRYERQASEPGRWQIDGAVSFDGLAISTGVQLSDGVGTVRGKALLNGPAPGLTLAADLVLDRIAIDHRLLTNLTGGVVRSSRDGRLAFTDLRASIYGGTVTGEVESTHDGDRDKYTASALLHEVDLHEFLNAGRSPDRKPLDARGTLDGRLYLSGVPGTPELRRGGGRVSVRGGRLFRIPLLTSMAEALKLPEMDDSAFHDLSAEFFLEGPRIRIRDLALQGPSLAMMGSGSLQLPDRSLDLILVSTGPKEWGTVPVLTELLKGASRELMEIRVRGPLDTPIIEARPFRGVSDAIETLFPQKHR